MSTVKTARSTTLTIARVAFLVLTAFFGWWSLRGDWSDIATAFGDVAVWRWMLAMVLVLIGLLLWGVTWKKILTEFGCRLPVRSAFSIFFLGQLGKYIPGSVWSFAAQGQMARKFGVPVRVTIASGLLLLYLNLLIALMISTLFVSAGLVTSDIPTLVGFGVLAATIAGLSPTVISRLGSRLAGSQGSLHTHGRRLLVAASLIGVSWIAFGVALEVIIAPASGAHQTSVSIPTAVTAFAIAFILGVLVPFAPSGLGIREAAMIYQLKPDLGLTRAAATALLIRVVHTVADFTLAAVSWLAGRSGGSGGHESHTSSGEASDAGASM